jgi:hypothetical protein
MSKNKHTINSFFYTSNNDCDQRWYNNRNGNEMKRRRLSLSDHQLTEVQNAAHSLLPNQRERFLEGLARRLRDEPSDEALREAIAAQLRVNRIPTFLCA